MDSIALSAKNLSKSFGTQTVLQDVHLHLTSGKIYGLVGRNGSGKTVLLKMLCGFMRPDKGEIAINGQPVVCGRKLPVEIGILFDAAGFIPNKTAYANLKILAGIRNRISPAGAGNGGPGSGEPEAGGGVFPGHAAAIGICPGAYGGSAHSVLRRTHE